MKIKAKFAEKLLAPENGIVFGEVETADGIMCRTEFQATWNNADGLFDDELDGICQREYKCSFQSIKSIWIGRLGYVSDYWHLVRLIKIEPKKGL